MKVGRKAKWLSVLLLVFAAGSRGERSVDDPNPARCDAAALLFAPYRQFLTPNKDCSETCAAADLAGGDEEARG